MKKKLVLLLAAAMAVSVLASGCGENETKTGSSAAGEGSSAEAEPEVYTTDYLLASTEYDVKDYVKLANYKKISVEISSDYEVTDAAREEYANGVIAHYPMNVETDKALEDGMVANIDYYGQMDGEAFEGGSAAGADLTIGSDSFIDGFEDGLIGHKAGDEVVLDLTFPENYHNADYAGKAVAFEVTVNKVYEQKEITYAEITDDYVMDNFGTSYGLTTVDDFNKLVDENLESNKNMAIQDAYLDALVEASKVTLPEGLLDERVNTTLKSYEEQVATYEMTLEDYISDYYQQTVEEFTADLKTQMESSLKEELVLEALVAELKCEVTSTEFNSFVSYFASQYYMTEEDFLEQCGGKDYVLLNYAEYYIALEEAAAYADVTFVDAQDDTTAE